MALGQSSTSADPVEDIIAGIRTALRELKCLGSERVVRAGLSMSTWHLMVLLERHGDSSMSRLAELLDVSLSNATGIVDRLEERGLVERVRVPDDRRIVVVRVSDAGRRLMTEVEVLGDEMLRQVLARLDGKQLARAAHAMEDIRVALVDVTTSGSDGLWQQHVHGQVHATAGVHPERPPKAPNTGPAEPAAI